MCNKRNDLFGKSEGKKQEITTIKGPDVDTRLYNGEMIKPDVQLKIYISSIILDLKHEFRTKSTGVVSLQRTLGSEHFINCLHCTLRVLKC